jgi:hypothetical protein
VLNYPGISPTMTYVVPFLSLALSRVYRPRGWCRSGILLFMEYKIDMVFGHVKDPVEFNSEKVSILIQITQLLMEMNCSRSEKLIILGPDK